MRKGETKKSVLAIARSWAIKNKLFGTQAFLRYVIFRFVENLNQSSDQFVFKGGNLLWVYIQTPRGTIDLDLSTATLFSEDQVRKLINQAGNLSEDIRFKVLTYNEISQRFKSGAVLTIEFKTKDGAVNQFEIDMVFKSEDDTQELPSPLNPSLKIKCVSIENIIVDKLSACYQFKSGNSRMKDFDDLWRLSNADVKINLRSFAKLLKKRGVNGMLDTAWINEEMNRSWFSHQKKYKDLPENLDAVFEEVNVWLASL